MVVSNAIKPTTRPLLASVPFFPLAVLLYSYIAFGDLESGLLMVLEHHVITGVCLCFKNSNIVMRGHSCLSFVQLPAREKMGTFLSHFTVGCWQECSGYKKGRDLSTDQTKHSSQAEESTSKATKNHLTKKRSSQH